MRKAAVYIWMCLWCGTLDKQIFSRAPLTAADWAVAIIVVPLAGYGVFKAFSYVIARYSTSLHCEVRAPASRIARGLLRVWCVATVVWVAGTAWANREAIAYEYRYQFHLAELTRDQGSAVCWYQIPTAPQSSSPSPASDIFSPIAIYKQKQAELEEQRQDDFACSPQLNVLTGVWVLPPGVNPNKQECIALRQTKHLEDLRIKEQNDFRAKSAMEQSERSRLHDECAARYVAEPPEGLYILLLALAPPPILLMCVVGLTTIGRWVVKGFRKS